MFFSGWSRTTGAFGGRPSDLSEIDLRAAEPTPFRAVLLPATARRRTPSDRALRLVLGLLLLFALVPTVVPPALAVQSVRVSADSDAIDLTHAVEHYSDQGDRIQVSTAPGPDGIVRRIEVSALEAGAKPSWIVFALTNDTDEQLTRLIVAPHFRLVGSGVVWPDLGSSRITTITASQGQAPDREDNPEADVFRLTLDPGTTVTYVAELRTPSLPQLYLWEPDAFKDKSTSLTLYEGILIGIAGLLALFLTIVFVVRGAMIFPAAAALAWAVFVYVCIEFGFWRKMFGLEDASERVWRAGVEATIAATLIVFLFAYLNLRRWHVRYMHFAMTWLVLMAAVVALSVFNAPVAAGVARVSIATVAGVGLLLILTLAARGSDRAVMLIPTWYLLAVWVVAAGAAALGYLTNDLAAPGLTGGLVLIVMLIGFTVMQFAFSGSGRGAAGSADAERRSLAMTGSGEAIFDWDVVNDQISGASSVTRSRGRPRAGWTSSIRSIATATLWRSTGSCISARAGSTTICVCAGRTGITSGMS
jgi:7TMR-DISM extracellular 2